MTQNLCQCHCGTRIDLDQQLLQQRQFWRQKYNCLQTQIQTDISTLKQNIYAQCANIMQQQFSAKEIQHNNIINVKNEEIRDLTTRIIRVQSQNKVLSKEKQILISSIKQLQKEVEDKDRTIDNLRSKYNKDFNQYQLKNSQEHSHLKKRLEQQYLQQIRKIQKQNQHLKHKVKQFQKKYQTILPQIQKLKNNLTNKTSQCQQLESLNDKQFKQSQRKIQILTEQHDQATKKLKGFQNNNKKLKQQIQQLSKQLQAAKKVKRQVKVQPVYIDRPIEVQKVVQKIVQVQKVVKQYIQPTNNHQMKQLQQDNRKLTQQLSKVVKQLNHIDQRCQKQMSEYQLCIKAHQSNTVKYKQQRQSLAKRIEEQNKQIQMLQSFIERNRNNQNMNQDAQKIIVHVKGDGSYSKTVERVTAAELNSRQNVKVSKVSNVARKK